MPAIPRISRTDAKSGRRGGMKDLPMTTHDCCATGAQKANRGYDLAVIGAGSAGFSAAITAAELGANVALIGHGTIGGTCVNIGCLPSKTMIRATQALHDAAAARF